MSGVRPVTFKFERENPDAIAALQAVVTSGDRMKSAFYFDKPYRNTHGEIPSHVYRAELERAIALKHGCVATDIIAMANWCKEANQLVKGWSKGSAPITHVEFETSDLSSRIPLGSWPRRGWK